MTNRKGFMVQQNTFLDTIATRFDGTHSNFVLGNALSNGFPIVYCSDGFCELTGHSRAHVMGKSCACKFLYGENTEEEGKAKIEDALEQKEEIKTEILLYRKDGNSFTCLLDIVPIKNEKSQVVLFLVSHKDVSHGDGIKENSDSGTEDDLDESSKRLVKTRCQAGVELPSNCNYQRRRSRAVLYHLSGQFDRHNRAKSKLQQLNKLTGSISGKMPEYKVQEVKKSKYVISHYGIFKIGWDWLILLCTFYTAIMVPYNAAFTDMENDNSKSSLYSDIVVEIMFIIDIALNFRTSFIDKSGHVVYDGRQIAKHYVTSWFPLDLLAAIPFDLMFLLNRFYKLNTEVLRHLLTLKLTRLLRLARLLQKIDRYSQYSGMVLALFMSMFALLAHWLACAWYFIGDTELQNNANWTVGWLYELGERIEQPVTKSNPPDTFTAYVTALYFTCSSLTSVGFGNVSANTNPEKIFSVCAMLIGAMMHAVVFGNVTAIIQRMYARRANYHSKTKDLKDFFRTHHIPKPLKQKMQEYHQTMWSMNNGIDTMEILKDFPEEMRGEIALHLHKDILTLPIFENATQGCLKSISLHTKRAFSAPGEFLAHKGDAINYVYLLCAGSMEVLKQDMVVAILGKGDLFGTDINFDDPVGISSCDVRSLTYCDLQCINMKGLTDVLALYPDFAEKFQNDIRHDLTYNLKEGFDESESDSECKGAGRDSKLPSISEDEEETDSDTVFTNKTAKNNNTYSAIKPIRGGESESITPLLMAEKQEVNKIPNGEVHNPREVQSPPSKRSILPSRRVLTNRVAQRRRQRHTNSTEHLHGMESLSNSIGNLHNEMEGTKTNMCHIEQNMNRISHEVSHIDTSLKTVIRLLSQSCTSESSYFPDTPMSPLDRPHFSLSSHNSDDIITSDIDTVTGHKKLEVPNVLHNKQNKLGNRRYVPVHDLGGSQPTMESLDVPQGESRDKFSCESVLNVRNSQSSNKRNILGKGSKVYRRAASEPRTFNNLSDAHRQMLIKDASVEDVSRRHNAYKYQRPRSTFLLETNDL
ncbi:potassium voltage-gated channel subfamily H member 8-like isoform X2 [Saccostrea echinata]|uniref:potassium voltage-gated channel subfamily H member 8-like isoform X2 n=1 Tax=Saccostrea echinata TaxID=191078 RepID=UPI002A7F10FE|nr:potassium voltage-gated channel subfamily H member 8-like isoform X2 [Saccostrea echinata]